MTLHVIRVVTCRSVIPQPGATHFEGDLRDLPIWWKYHENSTGTVKGWFYHRGYKSDWVFHSETKPIFLREIQPIITYEENPL